MLATREANIPLRIILHIRHSGHFRGRAFHYDAKCILLKNKAYSIY